MADEAFVTTSENGGIVASWIQGWSSAPWNYSPGAYTSVPVLDATGWEAGARSVSYSSGGGWGGIVGDQQYSGPESAPLFQPGIYTGMDYWNDLADSTTTFTDVPGTFIPGPNPSPTPGPIPETATWAMMLVGLGMIGLGARGRHNFNVAYA